jgi:hypothetical protein
MSSANSLTACFASDEISVRTAFEYTPLAQVIKEKSQRVGSPSLLSHWKIAALPAIRQFAIKYLGIVPLAGYLYLLKISLMIVAATDF